MKTLRVLHVEDSPPDAALIDRVLVTSGYEVVSDRVETAEDMIAALNAKVWDVVLSDYSMPNFDAISALDVLRSSGLDIPCIVISGTIGEETAVEAMVAGANDYLMKGNLTRLVPAIERELKDAENRRERKNAEASLRASEERLRAIYEAEPECVKLLGQKSELLDMNPAGLAMIGADTLEQVRGSAMLDLILPEYRKAFSELNRNIFKGESGMLEFEIIGLKGEQKWLDTHATPLLNDQGEVEALLGLTRDITEHKRAEAELRKSREHMALAQKVAKLGSWETNLSTLDVTWSDETCRIFEVDVDSFQRTHQDFLELVHPDDRAAVDKAFLDSAAQHSHCSIKHRLLMPDGRIKFIEEQWEILRDADNAPVTAIGTSQDITTRTLAEASQRASEERLRLLFDQMKDGFYYSTPDGKLLDINPAMVEMFGYSSREEMLKVDVKRDLYFSPEERKSQTLDAGKDESEVYRMRRKDGSEIWVEDRGQYKYDAEGNIAFHQGILRDVTERKLAEESLIHSEKRYRDLVENAYDMIYTRDMEGNNTSINAAGEKLTGYSREEFLQMNLLQIVVPEDHGWVNGVSAAEPTGIEGFSNEIDFLAKDGRRITVEVNRTLMYRDGVAVGVQGIARDTTERKRIEDQLIESESLKGAILESALDCVIAMNSQGLVTEFNSAAETVFGYSRADALGKELAELIIPPALRDRHRRGLEHYLATGEGPVLGKRIEMAAMRSDGTEFPVEIAISALQLGGQPAFTAFLRDITVQKDYEQNLKNSEERYRDLIENAHDIIYSHDLEGNYTSINAAAEEITGYTADEALKMNLTDTVTPDQLMRVRDMIERKIKGEKVTAYELEIIAKDGHLVTLEVNTKLVYKDGRPAGIQGIARDITQRKSLEEQLLQSQKLESVGLLAGGIAHDFNNMLTAINGFSELTLRQMTNDDPLRPNLEEIKKAGERSALLTNQLLAFSRKQILHPELIRVNDVIIETSNMLERLIGEDIELVTVLKTNVGNIKADPGQLGQIIINLAINARDAMPNGGKLTIETQNTFLDPEYVSTHVGVLPGAYIMLAVSDNGTGIPAETLDKIFEPFFTTKEMGEGTGLGLATVYGIVKQSGGGIFVYSEIGHGTTFKIFLPRVIGDAEETQKKNDTSVKLALGTETILLVEDEELVRTLARQTLESYGYTVIEACDGVEALEVVEKEKGPIDLIITDAIMPRMGGRELVEKLSAVRPKLPVLFASGYTDDAVVRHGVLEPNFNFIQKPFTLDDLSRKVRDVLDASQKHGSQ